LSHDFITGLQQWRQLPDSAKPISGLTLELDVLRKGSRNGDDWTPCSVYPTAQVNYLTQNLCSLFSVTVIGGPMAHTTNASNINQSNVVI
jgi:hypothetical protein